MTELADTPLSRALRRFDRPSSGPAETQPLDMTLEEYIREFKALGAHDNPEMKRIGERYRARPEVQEEIMQRWLTAQEQLQSCPPLPALKDEATPQNTVGVGDGGLMVTVNGHRATVTHIGKRGGERDRVEVARADLKTLAKLCAAMVGRYPDAYATWVPWTVRATLTDETVWELRLDLVHTLTLTAFPELTLHPGALRPLARLFGTFAAQPALAAAA